MRAWLAIQMTVQMTVQMSIQMPIQMTVARGFHRLGRFSIGHPEADFIEIETPDAANLKSGQAATFEQTINCDPMDVKVFG